MAYQNPMSVHKRKADILGDVQDSQGLTEAHERKPDKVEDGQDNGSKKPRLAEIEDSGDDNAKDHQAGQMTEGHYDSTIYSLHSTSSMPSRREPIPVDAENEPYPTSRELPQDPAEQGGRAKQEGNVAAAYVRNVMNRLAQAQSDKEDFAQQLAYYKERLQQAEERNQTLSGSIGFMNQRLTQLEGEWQRERGVVEDLQPYRDAARERMEERMAACVEFILEKVPEGTEIPMELLEMLPPARVDAIIRANEGANLV